MSADSPLIHIPLPRDGYLRIYLRPNFYPWCGGLEVGVFFHWGGWPSWRLEVDLLVARLEIDCWRTPKLTAPEKK